jgi:hypothetical protein
MTTIVCDGKTIWADSRGYTGDKTPIGTKRKVHRFEYGIFACSSVHPGVPEQLLALLKAQGPYAKVEQPFDGDALFLQYDGQVFFYGNGPGWVTLEPGQVHCIGSGAQYALGALAAGATPVHALECAISLDVWSSLPIYSESL